MSVRTVEHQLTADDLYAMGADAEHCELDEGRLVRMTPATPGHGKAVTILAHRLFEHASSTAVGEVWAGDVGFALTTETVRAPDVAFVRADKIHSGTTERGFFPGAPDLGVEVLSPWDWDHPGEFQKKVGQYLSAGTSLVWAFDARSESVVVYRADGSVEVVGPEDSLTGEDVLPGFSMLVRELLPDPGPGPASQRRPQTKRRAKGPSASVRRRPTS